MNGKVSLLTTVLCCLLVFIGTYAIPRLYSKEDKSSYSNLSKPIADCAVNMDQIRLKRYEYVQPLLLSNLMTESNSLHALRGILERYTGQLKSNQKVDEITVYFRKMNNGEWFCINPNQTYNPASMSKLIYILTYLKEAEYNPGVMNKKIFFAKHFAYGNQQNIKNFALNENQYYTVRELLTYMVQYSDNDATLLLSENMNKGIYHQIFIDLDLPSPPTAGEYYITAIDYSKFFRVLYNASYLNPVLSEYALKLLTESTFNDGIRAGVDPSVKIAHKFGERVLGNRAQLHEFGIVFYQGNNYLIGVLTKGSSLNELTGVLAEISRITFEEFKKLPSS